jgi:hypothetical protein
MARALATISNSSHALAASCFLGWIRWNDLGLKERLAVEVSTREREAKAFAHERRAYAVQVCFGRKGRALAHTCFDAWHTVVAEAGLSKKMKEKGMGKALHGIVKAGAALLAECIAVWARDACEVRQQREADKALRDAKARGREKTAAALRGSTVSRDEALVTRCCHEWLLCTLRSKITKSLKEQGSARARLMAGVSDTAALACAYSAWQRSTADAKRDQLTEQGSRETMLAKRRARDKTFAAVQRTLGQGREALLTACLDAWKQFVKNSQQSRCRKCHGAARAAHLMKHTESSLLVLCVASWSQQAKTSKQVRASRMAMKHQRMSFGSRGVASQASALVSQVLAAWANVVRTDKLADCLGATQNKLSEAAAARDRMCGARDKAMAAFAVAVEELSIGVDVLRPYLQEWVNVAGARVLVERRKQRSMAQATGAILRAHTALLCDSFLAWYNATRDSKHASLLQAANGERENAKCHGRQKTMAAIERSFAQSGRSLVADSFGEWHSVVEFARLAKKKKGDNMARALRGMTNTASTLLADSFQLWNRDAQLSQRERLKQEFGSAQASRQLMVGARKRALAAFTRSLKSSGLMLLRICVGGWLSVVLLTRRRKAGKKVNMFRVLRRIERSDIILRLLCFSLWAKIAESATETRGAKLRVQGCVLRLRVVIARKREQLCQQWAFGAWRQSRCYECLLREQSPPPAYTFHVCKWCWNKPTSLQSGAWPISHVPLSFQGPPQHIAPIISLQEDVQRHLETASVFEESCPDGMVETDQQQAPRVRLVMAPRTLADRSPPRPQSARVTRRPVPGACSSPRAAFSASADRQ